MGISEGSWDSAQAAKVVPPQPKRGALSRGFMVLPSSGVLVGNQGEATTKPGLSHPPDFDGKGQAPP